MQMMQTLDVRWEATAVLFVDLHLVVAQSRLLSLVQRYHDTSIWTR
jgi:hypothetical protein